MGFIKKQEDFVCEHCGTKVTGNGFTNHCPNCLWSKHVDENIPGDRKSTCLGLMEPIDLETKGDTFVVVHRCVKCGKEMKNKINAHDNFDKVLELSSRE